MIPSQDKAEAWSELKGSFGVIRNNTAEMTYLSVVWFVVPADFAVHCIEQ